MDKINQQLIMIKKQTLRDIKDDTYRSFTRKYNRRKFWFSSRYVARMRLKFIHDWTHNPYKCAKMISAKVLLRGR